ncbi:MAG TPA: hypothetical protein VKV18_06175 [Chthonomonas sp.]|uniref:hypothetical protein n=1 Tax=Chthonomonas sp. TaxID=2282153 RepID=UPI002B4B5BC6|nr:hypothetical protein [Chthonomonas sp.]HLI48263.1 hypothetical protein [Chthonomonas sp.]
MNGVVVHNGSYSYDGGGRLAQVVDSATNQTEVYGWNGDGTLASAPGPGYTRGFVWNEGKGVGLEYDSFGVAMYTSGNAQTPYRPAGLVLDEGKGVGLEEGLDFSGPPVACPLYANRALWLSMPCGGGAGSSGDDRADCVKGCLQGKVDAGLFIRIDQYLKCCYLHCDASEGSWDPPGECPLP